MPSGSYLDCQVSTDVKRICERFECRPRLANPPSAIWWQKNKSMRSSPLRARKEAIPLSVIAAQYCKLRLVNFVQEAR